MINLKELYEDLDRAIDKPHVYNRLISRVLQELQQNIQSSSIVWDHGTPYIFDPFRQKLLSLTRPVVTAGAYGNSIDHRYLRLEGVATMGEQGFLIPRPATIVGLWAKSRSQASWTLEVRKNGIPITLVSVSVTGSMGRDNDIDADLNEGDWIQFYINGTAVEHPIASCELSWRLEQV